MDYNVDSHRRTPRNESIVRLQRKLATVVAMSVGFIENDKFIAEFHVCKSVDAARLTLYM
jgi:hypothetical protein